MAESTMLLPAQCARSTLPSQHKNLTAWNSSTHCFVAEARPQIRVALLSENAQQCMNPTTAVQGKRLPLCVGQPLRHCAPSVQAPTASSAGRWPDPLYIWGNCSVLSPLHIMGSGSGNCPLYNANELYCSQRHYQIHVLYFIKCCQAGSQAIHQVLRRRRSQPPCL